MLHIFMCCTPFSINGIKVFAWLFTAHTHSHSHRVFSFFVSIVCLFARTFLNGHEINLFSERICAVDILYCELLPYKSYSLYVVMTIVCLSKWFVQQISFFLFLLFLFSITHWTHCLYSFVLFLTAAAVVFFLSNTQQNEYLFTFANWFENMVADWK